MKAYSMDLRERIVAACDAGDSTEDVAAAFSVSASWVRRLKQRRRESGSIAPKTQSRRGPVPGWQRHGEAIRQAVGEHPDATLDEYRRQHGLSLSKSALARAFVVLGLTRKKSRSGPRSKTGRT
jgi:transposase